MGSKASRVRRVLPILLLVVPLSLAQQDEAGQQPVESGIVETTGQRLIQLDVSFSPKKKSAGMEIPQLGPDDFFLSIGGKPVEVRYADRICNVSREESVVVVPDETEAPIVPPARPATYVFYFDHKLLTMLGQNIALEMAERLIPELIKDGNRGMVVSSGGRVVQSAFSEEPGPLLQTIDDVRKDTRQWSEYSYAQSEDLRYAEIRRQPSAGSQRIAARAYHLEELRITNQRLHRLSALIGGLAEVDSPKVVFYFADITRKRPGEHYLNLFTARTDEILGAYGELSLMNISLAFDDVLAEANAQGVRLYTIQAQGLQAVASGSAAAPNSSPNRRVQDAEDTMLGFAAETGGKMFYGGVDSSTMGKVLRRIDEDLGCFYLLSFDPGGLYQDRPLPVVVSLEATEAGQAAERQFEHRARGQIVIQSPEAREESLLLAAHATTATVDSDPGRGVTIPLGYSKGAYQVLVQFVVRGSELSAQLAADCRWDLGMTHVSGPDVKGKVSGRVTVPDPSAPVVLETLWEFEPGENEVVAVGHEARLGQLATAQFDLDWPDPDKSKATVSPIEVVQQFEGVFLRKNGEAEEVRYRGTLGVGSGLVNLDQPAYIIELVCRGARQKQDFWIRRELVGESSVEFDLLQWPHDGERCIQVRDLVREGQLGWGDFHYTVEVFDNEGLEGTPIATGERDFLALAEDSEIAIPAGGDAIETGSPNSD